ncbi:MAG: orotidine-5'-phosphate decarboxylase [Mariprofundales bacterium]|nr:orotidine-5'-phosphate decarboxylase [Mariprofundales bacterium]
MGDMRDRLMVALDVADRRAALTLRDQLGDSVGWFKIGLRLFVAEGVRLVAEMQHSHRIFLDLKFHDIPNTVAQAVGSAGDLGVDMVNVHAAGGEVMLRAAAEAAAPFSQLQLIAVTVLTSDPMPPERARSLAVERAQMSCDAGLSGVVCSVHEVAAIKSVCGDSCLTVTPGIRMRGGATDDQMRVADPATAIAAGADYLVVGRPVLHSEQPRTAVQQLLAAMGA